MRRLLILLWFVVFSLSLTPGQLVQFNFNNSADPSYKDNSISIADVDLSSGSFSFSSAGSYFVNEPYIQESGGWSKASYNSGKSFNVLLTGSGFSIKAIRFKAYSTSAGPSALTIIVNGDAVKTIDMPASTLIEIEEFVTGYTDINSAIIKLVGWDNGSRSTSGGGILKIDDLEISDIGQDITDSDTELMSDTDFDLPVTIIPGNSTVDIFSFIVSDKGTADTKPTVIKAFDLGFISTYNADKVINSIVLYSDGKQVDAGVTINEQSISFSISDEYIVVQDGTDTRITVKANLLNGNLFDGQSFRTVINSVGSFVEGDESSLIGALPDNGIDYGLSTIDVAGNGVVVHEYPETVGLNVPFDIALINQDDYGNRDSDMSSVSLTVESGVGVLHYDPNATNFLDGVIYIKSITIDKVGYYSLLFTSGDNNSLLEPIFVGDRSSAFIASDRPQTITVTHTGDILSVFRFNIDDSGATDNLPTKVKQFYIHRSTGSYNLDDIIKSAELYIDNDRRIEAKVYVESNKIRFYLPEDALNIVDGGSEKVTVKLYLNNQIADGTQFQLKIDDRYFAGETYGSSSLFVSDIGDDIVSDNITVDVVADRLQIGGLKRYMPFNYRCNIDVVATDRYGNIDRDANGVVQYDLIKGNVNLSATSGNIISGASELVYAVTGLGDIYWQVEASSDGYISAQSDIVYTGSMVNNLKHHDFESGNIQSADWKSSVVGAFSGERSLKHMVIMSEGRSSIELISDVLYINSGDCDISYRVKVGDWSINGNNCFYTIFNVAKERYILGVNYTGTDDNLKLWRVDNSRATNIVMSSKFRIEPNTIYSFIVNINSSGVWRIYAKDDGKSIGEELIGEVDMGDVSAIDSVGFTFRYTESSGGALWIDDLDVMMYDKPSFIEWYSHKSDSLTVAFSELINDNSLSVVINQNGDSNSDTDFVCTKHNNSSLSYINTAGCSPGAFDVNIIFADIGGNVSDSTITLFKYIEPQFSDIVFSEIHFSPNAGDKEFIELYNASSGSMAAKGCLLISGKDSVTLPEQILLPNSYLLLVSESSSSWAGSYSPLWISPTLPSLSSEKDSIKLMCGNRLIDVIRYSRDWTDTDDYRGRSLERINLYNKTNTDDNWTASVSDKGYTAGAENSVNGSYIDKEPPEIVKYSITDGDIVTLYMSESVNSSIDVSGIVSVQEQLYISDISLSDYYDRLIIRLDEAMQEGIFYRICFDNSVSDFQNNYMLSTDTLTLFISTIPVEGDIVINEVLFNPYSGEADFIEIMNVSDNTFELNRLRLQYYKDDIADASTVDIDLPLRYINPGDYFVISSDTLSVRSRYNSGSARFFGEIKGLQNFSDDNGVIELMNSDNYIVERLTYTKGMHYPFLADQNGVSLERIDANRSANATDNWYSASEASGFATPALSNSHASGAVENSSDIIDIVNKRFSPDNDGYEDRLVISYNTNSPGWRVYGEVFDIDGHNVADVFDGVSLSESGTLYWNGVTDDMSRVNSGIYLFHFKLFDESGKRKVVNIPFLVVFPIR